MVRNALLFSNDNARKLGGFLWIDPEKKNSDYGYLLEKPPVPNFSAYPPKYPDSQTALSWQDLKRSIGILAFKNN